MFSQLLRVVENEPAGCDGGVCEAGRVALACVCYLRLNSFQTLVQVSGSRRFLHWGLLFTFCAYFSFWEAVKTGRNQ